MISFIPLASSSSGCSYLVKAEGHAPLLLDAGLPIKDLQRLLWSEGVNLSDLAGCLISHGHGDHAKAVPKLLEAGVECYSSAPQARNLHHVIAGQAFYVPRMSDTKPEASWRIQSFAAVHDSADVTLGFLVSEYKGDLLLYLTDSAYCPYRFACLTHICVEANFSEELLKENAIAGHVSVDVAKRTMQTHASIERVIDMLKANDLSKVEEIWLLHLSSDNSDAAAFQEQMARATGKPVFIAPKRKSL